MSDNSNLRDALLKENGVSSVETELKTLHALVATQDRRARRLTFWTIAVWALWILSLISSLIIYAALERSTSATPATQPFAQVAVSSSTPSSSQSHRLPAALIAGTSLVLLLILPLVGIVLLIMMILARRSANITQLRSSLASLDAQLRLLSIKPQ